jgi:transglutaminase-like putative cysteine protease
MTVTAAPPHASPASPFPSDQVSYAALPPWVRYQPWPEEIEDPHGAWTDNGLLRVLHETQTSLLQPGAAYHIHVVQRVLTRAGAERAAQLVFEFDPTYERLELHHIRVWRGQSCVEHDLLGTSAFQLLRREKQLERLALNGRLSATLLIPDVRVGDRVEVSCTQYSNNPVLSGRYVGWMVFNSYAPWIETRHRLLRPLSRALHMKAFNDPPETVSERTGEMEESRWSAVHQERRVVEELVPPWTLRAPCYQITEFENWREISRLFEPYYRDEELPQAIALEVERLRLQYPEDAERAAEWLRLLQHDLRYFALALGEGSLVPRSLEAIWSGRFGDCKDAARLYVAGARRLGLDACAALVSTTHGLGLGESLPSIGAFNHMVVRLHLQGATCWLDPTMQSQGGSLANIVFPHAGWALPVTAEAADLEALPAAESLEHLRCEDEVQLGPKPDSPATLRRRLELAHWTADSVRQRIKNEGASKLSAQLLQELQSTWPRVVETSAMRVDDDVLANRLTVHFAYQIAEAWRRDSAGRWGFEIADHFTLKELAPLKNPRRSAEIFLGRPRRVVWRAQLTMPCRWRGEGWRNVAGERGAILRSDLTIDERSVVLERALVIGDWRLPPDRAEGYVGLVNDLARNTTKLWARVIFGRIHPPARGIIRRHGWRILVFAIWLLIVVGPAMCNSHPGQQ